MNNKITRKWDNKVVIIIPAPTVVPSGLQGFCIQPPFVSSYKQCLLVKHEFLK
jgi:hypothetical protein